MRLPTKAPRASAPATWLVVLSTVLATVVVVLLVLNVLGNETKIERRMTRHYAVADPGFKHELGVLLGPPFLEGASYRALQNGDQIFPAMLAAIRAARSTVTFETYIYWGGEIGNEFARVLSERARAGVKVHVLLDWMGSEKIDEKLLETMQSAGAEIRRFHPPHWRYLGRLNNRTHRKLLVVDGQLAYTGGVGIAPPWTGRAQDPDHWRDSHFEVRGPVVAQMQAVFVDNWTKTTGTVLHGPGYFPMLAPAGTGSAQMFSSSPSGGSESMQLMYLMAIESATRTIDLAASYFVPDDLTTQALVEAMRRGVKVRIIVPGEHIDSETVRSASRARWGPLLVAGALIAEYRPTMFHCKVMIVDGLLISVGSTNFDNRSFRLNDEATLNILDAGFAADLTRTFEADLAASTPITLLQWASRPWRERAMDRIASLIGSQL